jgi:hypothetical protein
MWVKEYSKVFKNVNKAEIWKIWTDINNWPKWHSDLESCTLEGEFAVGNCFMLKPKGMKAVKIKLTEVEANCYFTDCTVFPGAKMHDTHALEETEHGLKITNKLVVTGPLKWLWVKLVAQNVANSIPEETEALIELARSTHV